MGNFSRDPKTRLADAVAKHYISVRMQQGVPLLDADWNEFDGLRRHEVNSVGKWFIGDGVPSGSDGFFIFAVSEENDFGIRAGLCLVDGRLAENDSDVRYTTQPNFGNPALDQPLAALTTPVAAKQLIVYLDIWEREVDSEEDPVLVDNRIGVETAIRLKKEWAVRVAQVPEDLAALDTPPAGHTFYQLARLSRQAGDAHITVAMIEDLRATQLSVQRKIEVRNSIGTVVVNNQRFRQMLENTRNNLFAFIRYLTTQFNALATHMTAAEVLGLQAGEHIARTAESGLSLVNSENLANRGALNFLFQLYYAEDSFMQVWRDAVLQLGGATKKYATYQNFITRLDERLHLPTIGLLTGLLPALQAGNLAAATTMQEEIARLFGAASANVPRGMIQVFLANSPAGNLLLGQLARFEFRVRSFTTLADTYTVTILPATGWPRLLVDSSGNPIPNNRIPIGASGSEATIFVDVTVQAGSSDLQLRVTSDGNPTEIDQLTGLYTLTEGAPPPVGEDKVQLRFSSVLNGTLDPTTGIVNIQRTQEGVIEFRLFNQTGQSATFDLALAVEDTVGGWAAAFVGAPSLLVNNNASLPKSVSVTPAGDAVSARLRITASTTISGATTSGQMVIPLTATA